MKNFFKDFPKFIIVLLVLYILALVIAFGEYFSEIFFCSYCTLDGWSNTGIDIVSFPFSLIFYGLYHDALFQFSTSNAGSFLASLWHKGILLLIFIDLPAIIINFLILIIPGFIIKKDRQNKKSTLDMRQKN